MVIRSLPTSSDYDDLDAVNDFIKTVCKGTSTEAQLEDDTPGMHYEDKDSDGPESDNSPEPSNSREAHTEASSLASERPTRYRRFYEAEPISIRMPSTPYVNRIQGEGNHSNGIARGTGMTIVDVGSEIIALAERLSTAPNAPPPSSASGEAIVAERSGTSGEIVAIERSGFLKQTPASKCIFSKPDKVLLCDLSNIKPRIVKRHTKPPNKIDIGCIRVDSMLPHVKKIAVYRRMAASPVDIEEDPQPENEPIEELMENLNCIQVNQETAALHVEDLSNTYFMGNTRNLITMAEAVESSDFLGKDLYDMVYRKTGTTTMTENYMKLTENILICYKHQPSEIRHIGTLEAFFIVPNNPLLCYVENHRVDLHDSELFLLTSNSLYSNNWLFCCPTLNRTNLYNISNLEIMTAIRHGHEYSVTIQRNNGCEMVMVPNLEIVIHKNGNYHWYRMKSICSFLKWITAIQLRCNRLRVE